VKPHFNAQAVRHIGQLALAACIAFIPAAGLGQTLPAPPVAASAAAAASVPAAASAPPAKVTRRYAVVGYDRSIRQKDFAGLGKPTVLRMQQQLEVIYRNLADWKHDFALRERPLNDGIVGPVTLSWLQRYAFNFKFTSGAEVGKDFPAHMERMAAFAAAHPSELEILLDARFEEWDAAHPAAAKQQDFAVRRAADPAALIALVNRYRASRTVPPPATPAPVDSDGYYTYVLRPDDLERLGGKVDTGAILAKFKDKPYPSKEALKVALESAFQGRAQVFDQLWPVIDRNVGAYDGYLLNPANVARLKKEGVAASTLDQLIALGTVYMKSPALFDAWVTDKIATGELVITDDALGQLAETTMVFDNYHLDQLALDTIEKQLSGSVQYVGVPGTVVRMLTQIKEVDYPDRDVFHSAARSKILLGLGMCKPASNAHAASFVISDDEVASLHKELAALRPSADNGRIATLPELNKQFQQIAAYREVSNQCDKDDRTKASDIVTDLYDNYLKVAVEAAGRKKIPDRIAAISIQGGKCGCAIDDMAGLVYGFYPYWWGQKEWEEMGVQTVNFRVLNRMAYYGLTVDNAGDFRLGGDRFNIGDGSADGNAFVRIARQYNSKVDWLIQKNDWGREWQALAPQNKRTVFKHILDNISTLLNTPLSNPEAKLKGWTSFPGSQAPRRGDGVTLFFQNYPTDKDSTAQFNEFYLALRTEMDKHQLWLNILVTQDTLLDKKSGAGGAFGLGNLVNLRKLRGTSEQYIGPSERDNDEYFLVLLNEPSGDAKKALRLAMENEALMHGAQRADFLRSILPVVHFDDHSWQQLNDDFVYARDNFGGVALWAPDFKNLAGQIKDESASCLQAENIAVCLLKSFNDEKVRGGLPGPIEAFACVYRWYLHWIMLFLLVTGIVLTVLFFTDCKMQNFIKHHFLWVQLLIALPTLLIFILLLLYDPLWLSLQQGNQPFYFAAGIIMVGMGVGYRFWRAQRRVPQRERGVPQRQGTGFPIVVWNIASDKSGFQWQIKNRGTGYAIIKKVEILLDGNPVADAKTALESVMGSNNNVLWKSVPLVGQKLEPGKLLVGLSIAHGDAARAFEQKLKAHDLAVKITYSGPNNEHWISDGSGIMAISGVL